MDTIQKNERFPMTEEQKVFRERLLAAIRQGENAEEFLWDALVAWQEMPFKTVSGIPFTYAIHHGKQGQLTKELWIDRREGSKSLSFGSIRAAFANACRERYVSRPKGMGDIRGVSYMYPIFWRLGVIEVPPKYAKQMAMEEIQDR